MRHDRGVLRDKIVTFADDVHSGIAKSISEAAQHAPVLPTAYR